MGSGVRMRDLSPEQRKALRAAKRAAVEADRRSFRSWCRSAGLPVPHPEYLFHDTRKWRFDWAWPPEMVALEIEGGAWTEGRHTQGAGFTKDMQKYSEAAALGWRIVRVAPKDLYSGSTLDFLRRALGYSGGSS